MTTLSELITPSNVATTTDPNTYTAKQTYDGSTSTLALKLKNALEPITLVGTGAAGTITVSLTTQSIVYHTANSTANWTINFRGSSTASLDSLMAIGESISAVFLATNGSTSYFNNVVQIDGSTVTPKYQGGTAWSGGNINSIDSYVYEIIKTGNAQFTVLASQTKFA